MRVCRVCGGVPRSKTAWYCLPCDREKQKEAQRKYNSKLETLLKARIRAQEPKNKIKKSLRSDRYLQRRRVVDKLCRERKWGTPKIKKCATLFCTGTFLRLPKNGRRYLCDQCRRDAACYRSQMSHSRRKAA